MQIDFGFSIGQRVIIRASGLDENKAVVRGIMLDESGIMYKLSYWDGMARKLEWVFADEITAIEKVTT